MQPVFFGLAGLELSAPERVLFAAHPPAGFILFKRNVESRAQLKALTDTLREITGRAGVPILIDQEGGRVARLQPPEWDAFPTGAAFDAVYETAPMTAIEAARCNAMALGLMLAEVGINVNCAPLLDVRVQGAHDVIGDRAYGFEPLRVAALGRAVLEGLAAAGVVGVIKHIPGHGRAMCDSHLELPVVDVSADELETDLAPFIALKAAPMAMTAHIVYKAWDDARPGTMSPVVIGDIIRRRIGFDGLLMSDDLNMKALPGSTAEKTRTVLAAGCDIVLHCSGHIDEMRDVSAAAAEISDAARARLDAAMATVAAPAGPPPYAELIAKRDAFLARAGVVPV
ncbi:MAG: beta-N-acetylhexosaminidase [Alphaproteobacteria bacterium]|nr:beta-N-acetylhexosaminidase [Alphaproteobacteria bacterium]MDE2042039.1 beta-N-acetylhexosaminidase [Alphaproteobacteria bacterium]MDE2341361.1 beta-N-acetylhexosaminidase [Alphaproteobacteria bacterium]